MKMTVVIEQLLLTFLLALAYLDISFVHINY